MVVQGATACRTAPNVNVVNGPTATTTAVPIEVEIEGSLSSTSSTPSRPSEDPPPSTTASVSQHNNQHNNHIQHPGSTININATHTIDDTTSSSVSCGDDIDSGRPYSCIDEVPNEILADTIALILEQFISRSKQYNGGFELPYSLPKAHEPAALFFSPSKQTEFSLSFYIRRLVQYTCCSKSAFVVAVLYLARLSQNHPVFILSDLNVHRLICTSIVLAAKWLDDISYSNSHYARVSGVQTAAEMTRMENYFLKAIDFRLYVAPNNYRDVENSLLNIAASWS